MTERKQFVMVVAVLVMLGLTLSVRGHEITYRGTVLAVEPARLRVNTTDEKTKKESAQWFNISRQTRTKRGDKLVRYEEAMIAQGERVVVIVDHESDNRILVMEIRLAAK